MMSTSSFHTVLVRSSPGIQTTNMSNFFKALKRGFQSMGESPAGEAYAVAHVHHLWAHRVVPGGS